MKELIKPNKLEKIYNDENVQALCERNFACDKGFMCTTSVTSDSESDEDILF